MGYSSKFLLVFISLLFSQLAFTADLTLAPGKQANINGTVVACQSHKSSKDIKKFLDSDDDTLFAISYGGIGNCQTVDATETYSNGYTKSYTALKINGNEALRLSNFKEFLTALRKLATAGACD